MGGEEVSKWHGPDSERFVVTRPTKAVAISPRLVLRNLRQMWPAQEDVQNFTWVNFRDACVLRMEARASTPKDPRGH